VSTSVLYMSMSLDGFITGPNAGPDNGLGDGGERLHEWLFEDAGADEEGMPVRSAGVNGQVFDELMSTGAVVAGRGTFEPAGGWGGDQHDGVPIFILTRRDPKELPQWPLVTYVNDVTAAMSRHRATTARCLHGK
jgi:dihydrofolate reductase